ncbi:MAG: FAD-linked oxidase C-terminal domain-containing protein [Thermoguttaceae bacterium]
MSLVSDLRAALGRENILSAPSELAVYECDALTIERRRPDAVVFPRSSQEVAEVMNIAGRHGAAIVPRGAGTSLAGGCLPLAGDSPDRSGAIVLMLTRMNRVLEIDLRNRMALVEAGVANLRLTRALAGTGFHFAPDPSSQGASTIGGNVATNAGGPHTLKYGVTINHVLGVEAVLADGSIIQVGRGWASPTSDQGLVASATSDGLPDLDLLGLLVGSEGTLGVITKVWVRLTPNPQDYRTMRAIFHSLDDACNAVSQIIAAGIIPAALELMDQGILQAVEEAYHFGFPPDAAAVLVIEVDGPSVGLDRQQRAIVDLCKRFGASEVLGAASAEDRELLWKCRKMAVGTTGRLSPSYLIDDGVVPRTRLPEIIRRTAEIGVKHNIRIVNVAHAGDGNVHPILLFDDRDREMVDRAMAAGREILEACIALGGSVTAEHGVGVEKLELMGQLFAASDLEAMRRVRSAFDPTGRLNPGKLIPDEGLGARD